MIHPELFSCITPLTQNVWFFLTPANSPTLWTPGLQVSNNLILTLPGFNFRRYRLRAQCPQAAPTSGASCKSLALGLPALLFDLAVTSGVPTVFTPSPFFRFNTLLELPRKQTVLYYHQFIIKPSTQEKPNGREAQEKKLGQEHEAATPCPGVSPSWHLLFTIWTLRSLLFGVLWRSRHIGMTDQVTDHW